MHRFTRLVHQLGLGAVHTAAAHLISRNSRICILIIKFELNIDDTIMNCIIEDFKRYGLILTSRDGKFCSINTALIEYRLKQLEQGAVGPLKSWLGPNASKRAFSGAGPKINKRSGLPTRPQVMSQRTHRLLHGVSRSVTEQKTKNSSKISRLPELQIS